MYLVDVFEKAESGRESRESTHEVLSGGRYLDGKLVLRVHMIIEFSYREGRSLVKDLFAVLRVIGVSKGLGQDLLHCHAMST